MPGSKLDILRRLFRAAKASGRSPAAVLREAQALRGAPNFLSPEEFLGLRLYEKTCAEQRRYLGSFWNGPIHYMVASPSWYALVRDKLNFHLFFVSQGFAVPEILAVYAPDGRSVPGARRLADAGEIADYLQGLERPIFAKPIAADVGVGAHLIEPGKGARKLMRDGVEIAAKDLAAEMTGLPYGGYLFQELYFNSDQVATALGKPLVTFRMIVLRGKEASRLHIAEFKIRRAGLPNDNWDYGRTGNGIGLIDRDSGAIETAMLGQFPDMEFVDRHPDTGTQLVGCQLAGWPDLVDLTLRASRLLKGLGIQQWDCALTEQGPMLFEVNEDGNHLAPQACGCGGFWNEDLDRLLAEFGLDLRQPETIAWARKSARLVGETFGRDNAILGRGSFFNPVTRMDSE